MLAGNSKMADRSLNCYTFSRAMRNLIAVLHNIYAFLICGSATSVAQAALVLLQDLAIPPLSSPLRYTY